MANHSRIDLLQGTLDLLILRTLQNGPMHGWSISERIQQISQDVLQVNQGSLYPAMHRLEHQGGLRRSGVFRNWDGARVFTSSPRRAKSNWTWRPKTGSA